MNSQRIIQEIIDDILAIDPDLKKIKSELEKLIQELIANKPETPFTQEFKNDLKAQIIGAINDQKIMYEEKKRDWQSMLHSLKFWMIGVSSLATCFLVFAVFQYFGDNTTPQTIITEPMGISSIENNTKESEQPQTKSFKITRKMISKTSTQKTNNTPEISENLDMATRSLNLERSYKAMPVGMGGGASNTAENLMMLATPENLLADQTPPEETFSDTPAATPQTFCEASKKFLENQSIQDTSNNINKEISYAKQLYNANINFTNNNISFTHKGSTNNENPNEIPNPDYFLNTLGFAIEKNYFPAIIEDKGDTMEYYYAARGGQEGMTVLIDKTTNIIYSIKNLCIY